MFVIEIIKKTKGDEVLGTFIIIVLVAAIIGAVLTVGKNSKELKEKGVIASLLVNHAEGIPLLESGRPVKLFLYNDKIAINDQQSIALEKIQNIKVSTEKEITEKERSVIGRAALGGLLLGPVGAVVGGISGVKNKKKTKENYFLIIEYINKDSALNTAVFFSDSTPKILTDAFANSVISQIRSISPQTNTLEL